jgi:hypothetical protein
MARLTGQRLRSGLQVVANVTTSYEIERLAVQSDQFDAVLWSIAGDGTTCPTPARVTTNADLSQSDDGFYTWTWRINYMTFGMVSHWLTQFGLTSARSASVTAMTYNELNAAVYLQALLLKPVFPSQDAQYASGGYSNVMWKFVQGVIIT